VASAKFTSIDKWVTSEDPDFDIGCIHLSEPLGERVGWFAVGTLSPAELEGYLVNVSGYPGDRGMGAEQYHHKNRVLRVTERRVFYDVDTFGGQSGAPVWIHETENSPPIAIGIHAYGVDAAPGALQANSAPRIIPEVLEQIRKWVETDGGWPSAS
jgi:V8-like Glu-specific endopeptidase